MTFFCLWANNSHAFSLNSIQISFARMCKQAETEAVLVLAHYRRARARVCKYIHFTLHT